MRVRTQELTPESWEDVKKLFGPNGACGGCWCIYWRLEAGEKWDEIQGEPARRRLRKGIGSERIHGILAYVDGEPVGWCTFGPRPDFPRLERARTLKCDDSASVWAIPCFYIRSGYREQGVATALLAGALKAMKRRGARTVEGYPVKPGKDGRNVPAFAYTGTRSLFAAAGFKVVGSPSGGRQRVRREV